MTKTLDDNFGESNTALAENNYYVYVHTSPSGKKYVGVTRQSPERRWSHGFGYETNKYFFRAIKKYGWNNFKHEVLYSGLSRYDALHTEMRLIKEYDSFAHGYNMSPGGEGLPGSILPGSAREKSIQKRIHRVDQYSLNGEFICSYDSISDAHKITGVQASNISYCATGVRKYAGGYLWAYHDSSPNLIDDIPDYYDTTHQNDSAQAIPLADDFRSKCSYNIWNGKTKQVFQYDLFGNKIAKWDSAQCAANELHLYPSCICSCLKGRLSSYRGYMWSYAGSGIKPYDKTEVFSKSRTVLQIDIKTKSIIGTYKSLYDAEKSTCIKAGLISGVCTQKKKTAGGYYWMYSDSKYQLKERNTNSKPIRCIETGEIFKNAREVNDKLNISYKSVSLCCNGHIKYTHGLHFKFID